MRHGHGKEFETDFGIPLPDLRDHPRVTMREHSKTVLKRAIFESNGAANRVLLAMGSMIWGIACVFHVLNVIYIDLDNEVLWSPDIRVVGMLYIAHSCLMVWRLVDPVSRDRIGMCVNTFGAALWFLNTLFLCSQFSRTPGAALCSWIVTTYAALILLKTGKTLTPSIDGA